jgi:hypothetical protein
MSTRLANHTPDMESSHFTASNSEQDCSPAEKTFGRQDKFRFICRDCENEVSNSDQLLSKRWAIIIAEAGSSAVSFRSPELSQPSEVLSS